MPNKYPASVITLIHGTWSPNAYWTRPDAPLSSAIRQRFGDEVVIRVFRWNGRNSNGARRTAAARLQSELRQQLKEYYSPRLFLVGHSHGGNVATMAMEDPNLQREVNGLVCLSTPFLVARRRDFGASRLGRTGAYISIALLWFIAASLMLNWLGPIAFSTIYLAVLSLLLLSFHFVQFRFAPRLLESYRPPMFDRFKMLIIRTPGDEASAALTFGQFIAQLSVRLHLALRVLADYLVDLSSRQHAARHRILRLMFGWIFVLLAAGSTIAAVSSAFGLRNWSNTVDVAFATFLMISVLVGTLAIYLPIQAAFALLLYAISSAVIWPMVFVLFVFLLPLGWEFALANLVLEVSAEDTPEGSWESHLIFPSPSTDADGGLPDFAHSAAYGSPKAILMICNWLAQRGARSRRQDGTDSGATRWN